MIEVSTRRLPHPGRPRTALLAESLLFARLHLQPTAEPGDRPAPGPIRPTSPAAADGPGATGVIELSHATAPAPPFSGATGLTASARAATAPSSASTGPCGPKAHGGLLMVLLARAGLARLDVDAPGRAPDPLAVGRRLPAGARPGPVELHTEVLQAGPHRVGGRGAAGQDDRLMLTATVTAGRLPAEPARVGGPARSCRPSRPPDAVDPARTAGEIFGIAGSCELRFDPATVGVRARRAGPAGGARLGPPASASRPTCCSRCWPGDVLPPTVFNVSGRFGWAPTVQLTALLRAHPAPGWLRLESRAEPSVGGAWFDEDVTVRRRGGPADLPGPAAGPRAARALTPATVTP